MMPKLKIWIVAYLTEKNEITFKMDEAENTDMFIEFEISDFNPIIFYDDGKAYWDTDIYEYNKEDHTDLENLIIEKYLSSDYGFEKVLEEVQKWDDQMVEFYNEA